MTTERFRKTAHLAAGLWLTLWMSAAIGVRFLGQVSGHHLERVLQFGYDAYGRNLVSIVLRASAVSSLFAFAAAALSLALGIFFGLLLALLPRSIQAVGLRALEGFLAFPYLIFALALASVYGPGWTTLFFALLVGTVPSMTRFVYLRAREILAEDFVTAAYSLGAGHGRIALSHLLPSVTSLCRVKASNLFATALIAEASLSFLGVGAPIGYDTWGSLLAQGKNHLLEAPWIALETGLPLVLTVLSLQLFADNLA